jgi:hypothetical protein
MLNSISVWGNKRRRQIEKAVQNGVKNQREDKERIDYWV